MPLIGNEDFQNRLDAPSATQIADENRSQPEVTFSETFGAAMRSFNTISNVADLATRTSTTGDIDPDFDSLTEENLQGYEEYADRFIDITNQEDSQIIKERIDKERQDIDTLRNSSGFSLVAASLAAGALDPLVLIPVAKITATASRAGKLAQGFATGSAFGAGAGTLREGLLQTTKETRTKEDAALGIAIETAVGGIFGAAIGGLSRGARQVAKQDIKSALEGTPTPRAEEVADSGQFGSAGAMSTREAKIENERVVGINKKVAKGLAGAGTDFLSPVNIRGLFSNYGTVAEFFNSTFHHNFIIGKNLKGISRGEVAEDLIRQQDAQLAKALKSTDEIFRQEAGLTGLNKTKVFTQENRLKYQDFQNRVSRVLRDETVTEELESVRKAAKLMRAEMDKVTKRLQEAGVLDETLDPVTSRNYLMRIYDTKKLADVDVQKQFITKVGAHISRFKKDGSPRLNPLAREDAESSAQDILDNILGQGDKALALNHSASTLRSTGRFTKERQLTMADTDLEEFLVNDATMLTTAFVRRANAIAETQLGLKRLGYDSLEDLKKSIKAEHDERLAGMTSLKARQKANEDFARTIEFTDQAYDLMTGTLRKPKASDAYFDAILTFQFARLLGGSALSQLPELAMAPFRLGLGNTFRSGYIPLLRSMKSFKVAADQLQDLDVGSELAMNATLRVLGGMDDNYTTAISRWSRANGIFTENFGKLSGLTYVTYFNRILAGQVTVGSTVRTFKKLAETGKMTQKQITEYAAGGIDQANFQRVINQINKYGEEIKGSHQLNLDKWDDQVVARQVGAYIQNSVDSIILKPGKGDLPLFAQASNIGRIVFQFKSFASTATNRILLSGIQRRDARTLAGLSMLVALGALSGTTKDLIAGRDPEEDIDQFILDGMTRSGILGLLGTTALDIGVMSSRDKTRRYVGKFGNGQLMGPTLGMGQDVFETLGKFTDGNVTQRDMESFGRLLPYYNLFYIQALYNQLKD